jgi:hypothetical protein
MYSTCIFCHASLGTNEAVEHFPIGRRLAFDAAKGRLWVVCRKCERWNLTPLEERWEAIEECERLFTDTRLRVSTDNIGLARIREGLELVRIGSPLRPEMAAWRYGDQFGRRRRRHMAYVGAGVAAATGIVIIGPVTGIIAGGGWGLWNVVSMANTAYQQRRVRATLMLPGYDEPIRIRQKQLSRLSIVRENDDWGLRVLFQTSPKLPVELSNGRQLQGSAWTVNTEIAAVLTGDEALRAASKLLPAINASGANRTELEAAIRIIGESPSVTDLFARYAGIATSRRKQRAMGSATPGHLFTWLPKTTCLALEMATHEDTERRALEGELALLEKEWEQAEEIAGIADDMFLPDDVRARLAELESRGEPEG